MSTSIDSLTDGSNAHIQTHNVQLNVHRLDVIVFARVALQSTQPGVCEELTEREGKREREGGSGQREYQRAFRCKQWRQCTVAAHRALAWSSGAVDYGNGITCAFSLPFFPFPLGACIVTLIGVKHALVIYDSTAMKEGARQQCAHNSH